VKSRVIIKHRKFVPQIKENWWSGWRGICRGHFKTFVGFYEEFDTIEEAIDEIKAYEEQEIDDGKVVWRNYLVW